MPREGSFSQRDSFATETLDLGILAVGTLIIRCVTISPREISPRGSLAAESLTVGSLAAQIFHSAGVSPREVSSQKVSP